MESWENPIILLRSALINWNMCVSEKSQSIDMCIKEMNLITGERF